MSAMVEHLAEGITLYLGDSRDIVPSLGRVDSVVCRQGEGNAGEADAPAPLSRGGGMTAAQAFAAGEIAA